MQPKKKILSVYLLAIYLLVVLQSVTSPLPPDVLHHNHNDFEAVHHTHAFHIGVFHFLGHLLEKIGQQDDLSDDFLQPAIILPNKKANDGQDIVKFDLITILFNSAECDLNINDPPDLLPYLFLSQKANLSGHPLRAPPSFC